MLKHIFQKRKKQNNPSYTFTNSDPGLQAFTANPANTFLVSFPRTGSHWLRMLMELYFARPLLPRGFYYPERKDYLILHTHDLALTVARSHVIYLYRNPVDTIFSQLVYHKEPLDDHERISYWSALYGQHLDKWLTQERFTTHKTILTYEGLKQTLVAEFTKLTAHFGQPLNEILLKKAALQVTKAEVKRKTQHDPQVVQLQIDYATARQEFQQKQGALVWASLIEGRPHLVDHFKL